MKIKYLLIAILFFITSFNINAQDWGLGIRLGDPSGLTIKNYGGSNAFELSIGRTHMFTGPNYYKNNFDDWYKDNYKYDEYYYLSSERSIPLGIQLSYLFNNEIETIGGESFYGILQWYYGLTGKVAYQQYSYYYDYRVDDGVWHRNEKETITDIDLAGGGTLGLEYTFEEAPISVFLDLSLLMEVYDSPFAIWFQGGFGARYRF